MDSGVNHKLFIATSLIVKTENNSCENACTSQKGCSDPLCYVYYPAALGVGVGDNGCMYTGRSCLSGI